VDRFDRVVLIFNSHSTGLAPQLAEELRADLIGRLPGVQIAMMPTESAGHARGLALEAAQVGRPLIVSVSGDGGHNEVVDGVMQSGNPGSPRWTDADAALRGTGRGGCRETVRWSRSHPGADGEADRAVARHTTLAQIILPVSGRAGRGARPVVSGG